MKGKAHIISYIAWLALAFVLLFIQAQCDLLLPDYMSSIVSNGIAQGNTQLILSEGGMMLLIAVAGMVSTVLVGLIASRFGSGVARDLRGGVFEKVTRFSGAELDRFSTSTLITRSTNDITQIQLFLIILIRIVIYAPILGVGGVIKAMEKSQTMPGMSGVIAIAVLIMLGVILMILAIVQPRFIKLQKLVDKLNLVTREGLTGMMIVRAFNNERHEEQRFEEVNAELTAVNLFVNRVMVLLMPVIMLIMNGVSVAVVWVAANAAQDVADVANAMAFMQYCMQIIMAFMMVSMIFVLMPRAMVSLKRVREVLHTDFSVLDKSDAKKAENLAGKIEFDHVSFRYPGAEDDVLKDITFTAEPGTTTAIIGGTGSGKSTLVSLLPRLYDVTSGAVRIDDVDVRDYDRVSLRDQIGYVPQKSVLFSGTVESNLRYANEQASDADMHKAAEVAQAAEFIGNLEEGYDSPIAQSGSNVSGGQRQRLAIARALMKKCPIYVFDDSFSALDFKTDAALRQALKQKVAHASVLMVAQRVGSIMQADKIIVMADGEIVGMGTHQELMKNCEVYREIAVSQLSQEELANG